MASKSQDFLDEIGHNTFDLLYSLTCHECLDNYWSEDPFPKLQTCSNCEQEWRKYAIDKTGAYYEITNED